MSVVLGEIFPWKIFFVYEVNYICRILKLFNFIFKSSYDLKIFNRDALVLNITIKIKQIK